MTTLTNVKELGTSKLAEIVLDVAKLGKIEKFQPEDVESFAPVLGDFVELTKLAEAYALAYVGSFSFMVDMRVALRRFGALTNGQAKGVLNCMLAEARRNVKPAAQVVDDGRYSTPNAFWASGGDSVDILLDAGNVAEAAMVAAEIAADAPAKTRNGTYTVVLGSDDEYVTLKIRDDFRDKKSGKQMASFLSGSNNDSDFTGFAFVDGTKFNVWSRFKNDSRIVEALRILLNGGADEAGERFAMESGKCYCCGRTLTVPASLHRGLGPVCASRGS